MKLTPDPKMAPFRISFFLLFSSFELTAAPKLPYTIKGINKSGETDKCLLSN